MRTATRLWLILAAQCLATAAVAQSNSEIALDLQKLAGNNNKAALEQVVVIGSLLGCTQKTAGKAETNELYRRMKAIGGQVEGYCRAGEASKARSLMLATLAEQQQSSIIKAALGCYAVQKQVVTELASPRMATDIANYARWAQDPELAQKEMKDSDICHGPQPTASKSKR